MKNVAILTGGPSAERTVSENSAKLVEKYLSADRYRSRVILMEPDGWYDRASGNKIDLNDFSLSVDHEKITFDFVFLMIHGTPAEDGKVQGYFEMQGVPYSTCNTLVCALTFNKQMCKEYLRGFQIPMADSMILKKGDTATDVQIPLPVFVKPNKNGSSYGVTKVREPGKLQEAIDFAFQYDEEVMVEAYIEGREFGCGVIRENGKLHAFPVTEIIPAEGKDFFDYEAKYLGASQEITPADLPESLTEEIQNLSKRIYRQLDCRGVIRIDYILKDGTFHLLEVNTIPGMSEPSIVPQQARAYGWRIEHLLDVIVQSCS